MDPLNKNRRIHEDGHGVHDKYRASDMKNVLLFLRDVMITRRYGHMVRPGLRIAVWYRKLVNESDYLVPAHDSTAEQESGSAIIIMLAFVTEASSLLNT